MAASLRDLQTAADTCRTRRDRPLVLVTDDNEDTRFLLRTVLGARGYSVIEAADGEEAVSLFKSALPDLILMDASLPRLDGLGATRRIRQTERAGRVPIVFVSGHAEPAWRAVALDAGCDEYLVKPFDIAQIVRVLEKHLGKRCAGFAKEIKGREVQGA